MIHYKTAEEIELIRKSAQLVSKTLAEVALHIKPGVSTLELDKIAETFIRDNSAIPGFKGYSGFPNTLCVSVNEVVVHGIPSNQILKDGDIVSVDCGVIKNNYYGDSAYTFPVGEISSAVKGLLKVTKECLNLTIEGIKTGSHLGDIGYVVQQYAEKHSYGVVRELVGHGIGKNLHEDPQVPNYGKRGNGILLKDGLVIAIEPMINMGTHRVKQLKDGWTIITQDKKPSAHFEHTIAIVNGKADVLSTFSYIEENLNK
jgi:methionyl aminopeptidase